MNHHFQWKDICPFKKGNGETESFYRTKSFYIVPLINPMVVHPELTVGYTPIIINITIQVLGEFIHETISEEIIKDKIETVLENKDEKQKISVIIPYLEQYAKELSQKNTTDEQIIQKVRVISREIVEKEFPEEAEYFDFLFDLTIEEIGDFKSMKEIEFLKEMR